MSFAEPRPESPTPENGSTAGSVGELEQLRAATPNGGRPAAGQGSVDHEHVATGIREILASELFIDLPSPDVKLVEEGYLDSMDLVRLLLAIERRFGIEVQLSDLELADVATVVSLASAVARRI